MRGRITATPATATAIAGNIAAAAVLKMAK
jgi:hypothetical protein